MQIRSVLLALIVFLFAAGLTVLSLGFVRPAHCLSNCGEDEATCSSGACRIGDQRAGLPLPIVIDSGGSSPTGGWGHLGPEDLPNPASFVLDVLFYASLIWLVAAWINSLRKKERLLDGPLIAVPAGLVLICLTFGLYLYIPVLFR
ncbi:MAG TPA: hypothetical protein VMT46_09310 [Anaerolineaceae bacterium]|nr:hypothetical protein [Anaerolineaceae bacterium]